MQSFFDLSQLPYPIAPPGERMSREQMLQSVALDLIERWAEIDSLYQAMILLAHHSRHDQYKEARRALAVSTLRAHQALDVPAPRSLLVQHP